MNTLLAIGDSHASELFGKSWPEFLATSLDMQLLRASSPGAGNSFYIEKINHVLNNYAIDKVIIQLTDPSRVVTGFSSFENKITNEDLNHGNSIDSVGCYTWNSVNNQTNFKRLVSNNTIIDELWQKQVAVSKWVDYKVMQDVSTIQYICDSFNVPCIFWSWFVPMEDLFIKQYSWLQEKIKWIPGNATYWLHNNDIKHLPCYHYSTIPHQLLVANWVSS